MPNGRLKTRSVGCQRCQRHHDIGSKQTFHSKSLTQRDLSTQKKNILLFMYTLRIVSIASHRDKRQIYPVVLSCGTIIDRV